MNDIKWNGSSIKIEPPAKTKKLTGTRFASVLGAEEEIVKALRVRGAMLDQIGCALQRRKENDD